MAAAGFNPMRWKCERDGCFNTKRRPKIEAFAECFPRRINFGDVDGIVELCGKFCMLEWKGDGGSLRQGQTMTYRAFTSIPGNTVFVVQGDAETMDVERYCVFWQGRQCPWVVGGLAEVKGRIRSWVNWVQQPAEAAA